MTQRSQPLYVAGASREVRMLEHVWQGRHEEAQANSREEDGGDFELDLS